MDTLTSSLKLSFIVDTDLHSSRTTFNLFYVENYNTGTQKTFLVTKELNGTQSMTIAYFGVFRIKALLVKVNH